MLSHWKHTLFAVLTAAAGMLGAENPAPAPKPTVADLSSLNAVLLEKLTPSLVNVEYFFKLDEFGRLPNSNLTQQCPNCGSLHFDAVDLLINDHRPLLTNGFVVAPDEIITADLQLETPWLDRIEVVFGGRRYPARIVAWYPDQKSVRLKTAEPLAGAQPLRFQAAQNDEALYSFYLVNEVSLAVNGLTPYAPGRVSRLLNTGLDTVETVPNTLIVTAAGNVVGLSMTDELPLHAAGLSGPEQWQSVSAEEHELQLAAFGKLLADNVFACRIRLEPTPTLSQRQVYNNSSEEELTELDTFAVKLASGDVLVAVCLTPDQTARLDEVVLFVNDAPLAAQFVGSLKDFGAMIVKPVGELPGAGLSLFPKSLSEFYLAPVRAVNLTCYGDMLEPRVITTHIYSYEPFFKGLLRPVLLQENQNLLLSTAGELLSVRLMQRRAEERAPDQEQFIPSNALLAAIANPATGFDADNVPRNADERNRMAWLGVDIQPLDRDLARANQAAQLTQDGSIGLLITRIYPDSPAAALGMKVGDILLSITPVVDGRTTQMTGYQFVGNDWSGPFPWEQYDEIPEIYYEDIPLPWGSAKTPLNAFLTRIGIGREVRVAMVVDGKLETKEFQIAQAPLDFDTAARFTERDLGLTVADITYEVRNYFRMAAADPGVVIAKVRPGSKASIAGLKPYEIITAVNDVPVHTVAEFEQQMVGQTEVRFAVRRLAATRIVAIKLPVPEG